MNYVRIPRPSPVGFTLAYTTIAAIGLIIVLAQLAHASGPKFIAGTSFFNPGIVGTPLTWPNGSVTYYTDQGNLSPIMPGPAADAFVADAFSQWTSIATAAVATTHGGQLAEDVSGANVYINPDGSITEPADIMPSATGKPVAVVYDTDGSVTDALLGQGAGDSSECFGNSVVGGLDNFAANATFLHALIVINGNCIQTSSQTPDVEYRLVRLFGRVLGLDWSQMNLNVVTNSPPPTPDQFAGFPVMHAVDASNCVPVTLCYSNGGVVNPYQPKMDDVAALSSLYPVTSQNIGNFTGKQLFGATTATIQGGVYFANSSGQPGQPMQGVNVLARWIDPNTGLPSGQYARASVSGFLFSGDAGNMASGYNDSNGEPFSQYGSNQTALEGSFVLSGLLIPNGANSSQYQLSVEAVDPNWSQTIGPYGPWQVSTSGTSSLILVNVALNATTQQDIIMQGSKVPVANLFGPTSYANPAKLPPSGNWIGTINGYGDTDYLQFSAQAGRTLSVELTALNEAGGVAESKSQPVSGLWALADPGISPAPANTPSAFNTTYFGLTRLDATVLQNTAFRLGIADYRGDGRPDYTYSARLFYGDSITPARASVAGGTAVAIQGYGFQSNSTITLSGVNLGLLAQTSNQLIAVTPAVPDGLLDVLLSDPGAGGTSTMTGALTIGAGPTDTIRLLSGSNQKAPVGGQFPGPIVIQAVAADGVTPVAGASVFFSANAPMQFSACGGGASCTVLTDQSGQAATFATVLLPGTMTITAQLAPASYSNPLQTQAAEIGTETPLDVALSPQNLEVAQGASASFPLIARVLSNGSPQVGATVDYILVKGNATFSSGTLVTDSNGFTTSTVQIANMASDVQIAVCVGPQNTPCLTFYGTSVPLGVIQLQIVAGFSQLVQLGTPFVPVVVRAVDNSLPPLPVLGAPVTFQSVIARTNSNAPVITIGDLNITQPSMPVILSSASLIVPSDDNGLAIYQPSNAIAGAVVELGTASVGSANVEFQLQSLWPVGGSP